MNFPNIGLTHVAEVELSEPDYSFDLLGAWKDADGGIYLSTDSGCSCPSPWENHGASVDDFTGPLTAEQAREEADSLWKQAGSHDPDAFVEFIEALA